jgi:hypothetical protein
VTTVRRPPTDRSIGPTAAELITYQLVVGHPHATASELATAHRHGSPEDLTEPLATLVARGLVAVSPDVPARYRAIDPDVALDVLVTRDDELREARQHAGELAQAYESAVARGRGPVELIDAGAVPRRIAHLRRIARHQVRSMDRSSSLPTTPVDAEPPDVAWRTIYEPDAVTRPDAWPEIQRLTQAGHQLRVVAALPATLWLADNRLAIVAVPGDAAAALVVHPCSLLDALDALFEALWERALPLGPASSATVGASGYGEASDQLEILLLAGLTDQAIARRIGVGHRTAQRRTAALLKDLGARTRFQAGVQTALRDLARNPTNGVHNGTQGP